MKKDIIDMLMVLKFYNLSFVSRTIYEDKEYYVLRYKNTNNYFCIRESVEKGYYGFKGLTDKNFVFEDIYSSSEKYRDTFKDLENLDVVKENIYILAKKFINFIDQNKSLDNLLEEGKTFKEINNYYKENNTER